MVLSVLLSAINQLCHQLSSLYLMFPGEGRSAKIALWEELADDITGVIARSEKVAGTFQKVFNFKYIT